MKHHLARSLRLPQPCWWCWTRRDTKKCVFGDRRVWTNIRVVYSVWGNCSWYVSWWDNNARLSHRNVHWIRQSFESGLHECAARWNQVKFNVVWLMQTVRTSKIRKTIHSFSAEIAAAASRSQCADRTTTRIDRVRCYLQHRRPALMYVSCICTSKYTRTSHMSTSRRSGEKHDVFVCLPTQVRLASSWKLGEIRPNSGELGFAFVYQQNFGRARENSAFPPARLDLTFLCDSHPQNTCQLVLRFSDGGALGASSWIWIFEYLNLNIWIWMNFFHVTDFLWNCFFWICYGKTGSLIQSTCFCCWLTQNIIWTINKIKFSLQSPSIHTQTHTTPTVARETHENTARTTHAIHATTQHINTYYTHTRTYALRHSATQLNYMCECIFRRFSTTAPPCVVDWKIFEAMRFKWKSFILTFHFMLDEKTHGTCSLDVYVYVQVCKCVCSCMCMCMWQ